jgi:hypothetical protein
MTMRDISRRLDRLDSARPIADRRVIRMVQEEGETQADAITPVVFAKSQRASAGRERRVYHSAKHEA